MKVVDVEVIEIEVVEGVEVVVGYSVHVAHVVVEGVEGVVTGTEVGVDVEP